MVEEEEEERREREERRKEQGSRGRGEDKSPTVFLWIISSIEDVVTKSLTIPGTIVHAIPMGTSALFTKCRVMQVSEG